MKFILGRASPLVLSQFVKRRFTADQRLLAFTNVGVNLLGDILDGLEIGL